MNASTGNRISGEGSKRPDGGFLKIFAVLLIAVFGVLFLLAVVRPVDDPDTFWHLATGKWIVEHRALPEKDPFGFTTQHPEPQEQVRVSFILRQYWMGQIIMYAGYLLGGYWGIICLRAFLFLSILLVLVRWFDMKGVAMDVMLFFLIPAGFILLFYEGDRPNQMSFLFAILVFYLIDNVRTKNKKTYLVLPLMLLWSNIHAGYILGDILLGLAIIDVLLSGRSEGWKHKVLSFGAGIVISFLNPNHINIFPVLMDMDRRYLSLVNEMLTPIQFLQWGRPHYLYIIGTVVAVLLVCHIIDIRMNGRKAVFQMLVTMTLVGLSMSGIRYIPFLVLLSLPFVASQLYRNIIFRVPGLLRLGCSVSVFVLFVMFTEFPAWSVIKSGQPLSRRYPENVVKFMKDNTVEGNLFNTYNMGGYLLWHLYPDNRVFIDGRALSMRMFFLYNSVVTGDSTPYAGVPMWKRILQRFDVKYAVVTPVDVNGRIFGIILRLHDDPDWSLNYIDPVTNTMFFSTGTTLPVMPGILAYSALLSAAESYRKSFPDNPRIYVSLAEANLLLGRRDGAIKVLREAISRHPSWKKGPLDRMLTSIQSGSYRRGR